MDKKKVLIPDEYRLQQFSDGAVDCIAKDKKLLKNYLKQLHNVYNNMVEYVNGEYGKREELKEYLDKLWEQYDTNDWEVQDIVMQAELKAKKEILESIREKSGLYKTDVFYDEVGSWQDNMDICEPCCEDDAKNK